jgi:hypothetical protein
MAGTTIQGMLDARDGDGGEQGHSNESKLYRDHLKNFLVVKLDLDTPNHASAAKLFLKIKSISEGNKEDLKEAVDQAGLRGITSLPSMIDDATDIIQTTDAFVQGAVSFGETWGPILKKLEAFQVVGDYLSEVSSLSTFFILYTLTHHVDTSIRKNGLVDFEFHTEGESISFEIARHSQRHVGGSKTS